MPSSKKQYCVTVVFCDVEIYGAHYTMKTCVILYMIVNSFLSKRTFYSHYINPYS